MFKKCWKDTLLGNDGEYAWCLVMLLPIIPFLLYWIPRLIFEYVSNGAVLESVLFILTFTGVAFISVMFVLQLLRLNGCIQIVSGNENHFLGQKFFNRKFSFFLEDVEDIQMLKATKFRNSIGSLADIVFTIKLKDGARLSALNTMDDYKGLLETLKSESRRVRK